MPAVTALRRDRHILRFRCLAACRHPGVRFLAGIPSPFILSQFVQYPSFCGNSFSFSVISVAGTPNSRW